MTTATTTRRVNATVTRFTNKHGADCGISIKFDAPVSLEQAQATLRAEVAPSEVVAGDPAPSEVALRAAGYTPEHNEASWEDVGGPESGPKLVGCGAHTIWARTLRRGVEHIVVIMDDAPDVVEAAELQPNF